MIPACCCCGNSPGVWNDPDWYASGGTQDFCPEHAQAEMNQYIGGEKMEPRKPLIDYLKIHPQPCQCPFCRSARQLNARKSDRRYNHPYKCPVCLDGTIEKEHWEMLYGNTLSLQTCGSSPKHLTALKIWIGKQIDAIDGHGCESCWSDSHGKCTCEAERLQMRNTFLTELNARMHEVSQGVLL